MRRRFLIGLTALLLGSFATILPLCHALFRCGCSMLHGERACNIHDRFAPHCPWCEGRAAAFLPGYAAAMGVALAVFAIGLKRADRRLWLPLAFGAAIYLVVMALAALVTAKVMHYPYWLGWRIG
jgi:hypothetical protein